MRLLSSSKKVDDDFGERDFEIELDAVRGGIFLALVDAAPLGDQVHDRAVVIGGGDDLDVHPRFTDLGHQALVGQFRRGGHDLGRTRRAAALRMPPSGR